MHKKAWFFKNKTVLGMLGVMLAFGTIATGCPADSPDSPALTTYKVTFDVDGGSAVSSKTVESGGKVARPATNPTKDGYTFANWYRDANKTILWNFGTDVITKPTTIYAKWVPGENVSRYTVTFDTTGGSTAPATASVLSGEKVAEPAAPTKAGNIFVGWYNGEARWDFGTDSVSANTTLTAKWVEAFTVTFNTNGGSAIAAVTVAKGGYYVNLSSYTPTKSGNIFEGWYTDAAFATAAPSSLKVTANITLYAKWTSTSALAPYAGVWREEDGFSAYVLEADGTAWHVNSNADFWKTTWSLTQLDGDAIAFNADKTEFTLTYSDHPTSTYTYTKNTTDKVTSGDAAPAEYLGVWTDGNDLVELKANNTVVFTYSYGGAITLNYYMEDKGGIHLVKDGLLIVTLNPDNFASNFSKKASDKALEGIWKLTMKGQNFYWNVNKDGQGTFHTLGASAPASLTVSNDGKGYLLNGYGYDISGATLTIYDIWVYDEETGYEERTDIPPTKVDSVPPGSGAGGDNRLYGTWKGTSYGYSYTLTINSNGTVTMGQKSGTGSDDYSVSAIWKADISNGELYIYQPNFIRLVSSSDYSVSGSALTYSGIEFTK